MRIIVKVGRSRGEMGRCVRNEQSKISERDASYGG